MPHKILVVDDEEAIVELTAFNLKKEGYEVVRAFDGREALRLVKEEKPDLIVLDLMLPEIDGLEVCRRIRQESRIPILILSAKKEEVDRIIGLELGADDYVTKPFSPRELLARVKAILRRSEEIPEEVERVVRGSLVIDKNRYEARINDMVLALTPTEFKILETLANSPGQVYSRDVLLRRVWGYDYIGDSRTVDVHIRHLREKLNKHTQENLIETVRGVGYRFSPDVR